MSDDKFTWNAADIFVRQDAKSVNPPWLAGLTREQIDAMTPEDLEVKRPKELAG